MVVEYGGVILLSQVFNIILWFKTLLPPLQFFDVELQVIACAAQWNYSAVKLIDPTSFHLAL